MKKRQLRITRREFAGAVGAAAVGAAIPRLALAQDTKARADRQSALDHIVVIMFENRSFDNVLGRLYAPGEVASFEGVIGKDLRTQSPIGQSMVRIASSYPTEWPRT